jgi:tetratricopeptide (TPR) repeat protein
MTWLSPTPPRWRYLPTGRDAGRALALVMLAASLGGRTPARGADSTFSGALSMREPGASSLLVDYFTTFLGDQDIEAFRRSVAARYNEGTLCRLARSGGPVARRAAVLALGLIGSMQSNPTVGRGLRDDDPTVRSLAQSALWAIWFRAGTPAQNARLAEARNLISLGRLREAEVLATRLIEEAPDFAEAHNQRAIAVCFQGRFADSAADCLKVLELNPFHIGALDGLGQCYLGLGDRRRALEVYQRALKLQPYNDRLRELVSTIEEARD